METTNQVNPFISLIPLIIVMIPMIFVVNKLAKEKGLNITLWTILACVPFVNLVILPYIIGTPSKILEAKMDLILEAYIQQNKNKLQ